MSRKSITRIRLEGSRRALLKARDSMLFNARIAIEDASKAGNKAFNKNVMNAREHLKEAEEYHRAMVETQ